MSVTAFYGDSIDRSLLNDAQKPAGPEAQSFSLWSALKSGGSGVAQGGVESAASALDYAALAAPAGATQGALASGDPKLAAVARGPADFSAGRALRRKADEFAPSPETSSTSDQVLHGLGRSIGKAVGDAIAFGPAGGAVVLAADEGNTTTQRLIDKGVPTDAALKVGAVQGVTAGLGMVAPIGGSTALRTAGIVGVVGPGAFVAQESLSRDILQRAGQQDEAKLHDPLDPLGLGLSTVLPGLFGAVHARNLAKPRTVADVVQHIESGGRRYGADGQLLTSPKGAQGEMQVMPGTATDPGFGVRPAADNSPDELARVGRDYITAMQDRYGSTEQALAAYNAGPGAVDKALREHGANWLSHMPDETRAYVDKAAKFTHETAVSRGAADPEAVDAARVRVLNDHMLDVLPEDMHDAMPQVLRAADELGAGRMPDMEPAPRLENLPISVERPLSDVEGQPPQLALSPSDAVRLDRVADQQSAPREPNALPTQRQVVLAPEKSITTIQSGKGDPVVTPELQRVTAIAEASPDLRVRLPGSEETVSIADAIRRVDEAHAVDKEHASLVEAAWQCAMGFGG